MNYIVQKGEPAKKPMKKPFKKKNSTKTAQIRLDLKNSKEQDSAMRKMAIKKKSKIEVKNTGTIPELKI